MGLETGMSEAPSIRMDGKVALITGGGAGIGKSIAQAFLALGAKVIAIESDFSRAQGLIKELSSDLLEVIEADVRDENAVASTIFQISKSAGKIDVLVNNVGDFLGKTGNFESFTALQWDELYQTNLRHVFVVTKAVLPLMRKAGAGASVINLSSIEGFRGMPHGAVYAAFKLAVVGFTKSLALELGRDGIRVNAIAPDTTETPQVAISTLIPEENKEHIARWWPLGRFGTPGDAAGCAVFLATDLSAWITGTTIHLDGGALAACGFYRAPDGTWTNKPVIARGGTQPAKSG